MAVKFEIFLDETYVNRLWAIKEKQGKDNLTGNEFAKKLLEDTLFQLHPNKVEDEE